MSATCYIYTWHHSNENFYWGFYNLCVCGSYVIGGKTLVNPVFSYCPDSKLRIYPHGKTFSNYPATFLPSGYDVWRCTFYSDNVAAFISKISSLADGNTLSRQYTSSTDYYLECNLKQHLADGSLNPFYQYSASRYNCFAAVATWVSWLGSNLLLDVYNSAHNVSDDQRYMEYIPTALFERYAKDYWQKTDYNNTPTTTLPVT